VKIASLIAGSLTPDSDSQNMIANPLAENHHSGGTRPPEARELRLVQVALSSLNTPKTMQLKEVPLVALHWQAACCILSQNLRRYGSVFLLTVN
jgi:hypothetical protein